MELKKDLTDLLIDSLEQLIKLGSNSSFWGATRANSDAVLALTSCLPEFDYYKLKSRCIDRISREANESNGFVNWDEEIWDTSIAILALSTDYELNKEKILKALNWIQSKYIPVSQSWNEEVWETLLALNAINYSSSKSLKNNKSQKYYEGSVSWISSLYNTPKKGILINWSSTALYLLFAINFNKVGLEDKNINVINEQIESSCEQILNAEIDLFESSLWTSETWSNGLVLWAISEAKSGTFTEKKLIKIISWFRERILLKETPIEDKAFACIGIFKYLEYLEIIENGGNSSALQIKERLQEKVSKYINTRIKDFVPHPPLLDKGYHADYYTINLNKRLINVSFILMATFILTYFTIVIAKRNDSMSQWLSIIPVLLGVFATVAQLANFQIFALERKNIRGDE